MDFVLDEELTIPAVSPVCVWCRHLHLEKIRACDAYTEEETIPLEIWNGDNKHTEPYAGDNGIQFEPLPKDQP